jgi:hypothetical protein
MISVLKAALAYVARGWRVFPVHGIHGGRCTCGRAECSSPGKHPLTRRGLHDATTNVAVIEAWWRQWRRANVAIATGRASGFVVVDLDLPSALASLDALVEGACALPTTLTALTGGGGVHLYYAWERELGNAAGKLPGCGRDLPGVDLRADGGYVLVAPSVHVSGGCYEWLDPARDLEAAPAWLRQAPRRVIALPTAPSSFEGDGTRVGLKVLRCQVKIVSRACKGERNHTLNRCAFVVARYVAAGHLREIAARGELTRAAVDIGLTAWETERTIDSAFSAVGPR